MSLNEIAAARRAKLGLEPEAKPFTPLVAVPEDERDESFMNRASSWAQKALEGRAEQLASMAIGDGRNNYLNKSGWVLLRFALAGHLDAQDVLDTLGAADGGALYPATRKTLESAWKGAHKHGPADPPIDADVSADLFFDDLVEQAKQAGVKDEDVPPAPPMPEPRTETPEQRAARLHHLTVVRELAQLRARDEAKTLFAAEKAEREFREPPSVLTLREQLLLPREPVRFTIADVLPRGGNALLTAQYKAGKTTLNTALLRSYADCEPFLGRFPIVPHAGRIAIFNYELSQQQYDQWLEDSGIVNQERVAVLHLRGFRLDIRAPAVEDWVVRWLVEHEVSTWIADPFARAAVGVEETSNTEVGVWLDTFDVIKERAGVIDGVLTTHTGRAEMEQGQERARGATRLDDWADVRWILTKNDDGDRFFRATGRDVEIPEEKLNFDPLTRALTIGGGDRTWVRRRRFEDAVVAFVQTHPGATGADIERGVEGKADGVRSAVKEAVRTHRLRVEEGLRGARLHYSNE